MLGLTILVGLFFCRYGVVLPCLRVVEGGGVRLNTYPYNGPISDDWGLLKKNPPVVDEANRTVTFEINEYDPSKSYHYINVGITYYNKESGTSYNSVTIKIVQDAPAQ